MDAENVKTVVDKYIASLKDRRTQYAITEKFARNPTEASRAEIEHDFSAWYFGFTAGVKLVDQKARLPPLEAVLAAALEKFEEGIAA
jgi:hypothetical protein